MEDIFKFIIWVWACVFVSTAIGCKTWDNQITEGKNIVIKNAVYQCKKTKELILEEK